MENCSEQLQEKFQNVAARQELVFDASSEKFLSERKRLHLGS